METVRTTVILDGQNGNLDQNESVTSQLENIDWTLQEVSAPSSMHIYPFHETIKKI